MISGKRPALLLLLLIGPTLPSEAVDRDALDAKLAEIARPVPASTPFVDVRTSRLLKRPLVVSGTLEYAGPGRLARRIEKPYVETTTVDGEDVRVARDGRKPRRFSLARAPELRGLLASFGALLAGDRVALERHFDATFAGSGAQWTLTLAPKDKRAQKHVGDVVVLGTADAPRCIVVREKDGDTATTLLGVPVLSAPPTQPEIDAYCRSTP